MCALYNLLVKSYTVAEIRVAAMAARKNTFRDIDHIASFLHLALKNQSKGKPMRDSAWIEARRIIDPTTRDSAYPEIVTGFYVCAAHAQELGPFRTYAEAERAAGIANEQRPAPQGYEDRERKDLA